MALDLRHQVSITDPFAGSLIEEVCFVHCQAYPHLAFHIRAKLRGRASNQLVLAQYQKHKSFIAHQFSYVDARGKGAILVSGKYLNMFRPDSEGHLTSACLELGELSFAQRQGEVVTYKSLAGRVDRSVNEVHAWTADKFRDKSICRTIVDLQRSVKLLELAFKKLTNLLRSVRGGYTEKNVCRLANTCDIT